MELFLDLLVAWECGGGTILIYLLTSILKFDQHISQGANLIFFIPTCITSIVINTKNKNIDFNTAIPIVIAGIIGSIFGALFSIKLDIKILKKCFGIFLILISLYEIFSLIKKYKGKLFANNKNKKI